MGKGERMAMRMMTTTTTTTTRRRGGTQRRTTARAVQVEALFKKKEAAAPAKKKKAAPPPKKASKKAAAPKGKKKADAPQGPSLIDGVKDILGQNADTIAAQARSGSLAKGAQRAVGYRGSGQKGSAPQVDAQGNKAKFGGVVYRFGDKYKGGIDEYSPIFTPEERSSTGDTYAGGLLGLAIWFVGLSSLLAVGGYSIYATSALS